MTDTTPTHVDETDDDRPDDQPDDQVDDREPPAPAPMIIADGLDYGTGDRRCFAGLDFEIPADRLAVITGPAGSGKSILLAAIVGRFTGFRGRLSVAGLEARSQARRLRRISTAARIGSFVDLEPKHSIADAVAERAAIEGLPRRQAETSYNRLAPLLDLDPEPDRLVDELAGYDRTALAVVLALLRPATVLVLDDLHHDLNSADQQRLLDGLAGLAADTSTTIIASSIETTTIPYDVVRICLPTPGASRTTSSR